MHEEEEAHEDKPIAAQSLHRTRTVDDIYILGPLLDQHTENEYFPYLCESGNELAIDDGVFAIHRDVDFGHMRDPIELEEGGRV